jgi:pSer/pThr/pTyr-binding forkhead associated (FHA) protein
MSLKRWMLGKVNETGAHARRGTQRRIPPSLRDGSAPGAETSEPTVGRSADREREAHLGPYAPLIAAIRDELEQFVASQLRLHLAIAERDRYVLTSVEVECAGSEEHRTLLRRFIAEFRPEQIKHYLARDIIAGLRNASAIDLTQFAGLNAAQPAQPAEQEDPYRELLADLQSSAPGAATRPFEVTLVGRWSPTDAPMAAVASRRARPDATAAHGNVHTPLAGRTFVIEAEDAGGARRIDLASIVPGRRYVIGKDGGCDVVVEGVYASRRHCEIWFDKDTWWVADAGSTNGIRVEASGSIARADPDGDRITPIELPIGASLVLSARARGSAKEYPRVAVHAGAPADAKSSESQATTVPVTPIAPPRPRARTYTVAACMASGMREAEVGPRALPFSLGRSRNQTLIVDWDHNEVSGRHLEIVALDDDGASVIVHGDNGVDVDGTHYAAGAQFRWLPGQAVQLGRAQAGSAACTLTLSRTE